MDEAMLDVISYGSYYRLSRLSNQRADFEADEEEWTEVLLSADGLETPNIRIWAGRKGSADTSAKERAHLIFDAQMIAESIADDGMEVSFEYHGGTLTDTPESAVEFIRAIDRPNAKLYWQPNQFVSHEENLRGLEKVLPYLSNVHVFAWEGREKFPLVHHRSRWLQYLEKIKNACPDAAHALLLEFVCDDTEEQFKRDAEELHHILKILG